MTKVRDMPNKLSLPRQGPWNLVWVKQVSELSEVELTEFYCISIVFIFSAQPTLTVEVSHGEGIAEVSPSLFPCDVFNRYQDTITLLRPDHHTACVQEEQIFNDTLTLSVKPESFNYPPALIRAFGTAVRGRIGIKGDLARLYSAITSHVGPAELPARTHSIRDYHTVTKRFTSVTGVVSLCYIVKTTPDKIRPGQVPEPTAWVRPKRSVAFHGP